MLIHVVVRSTGMFVPEGELPNTPLRVRPFATELVTSSHDVGRDRVEEVG